MQISNQIIEVSQSDAAAFSSGASGAVRHTPETGFAARANAPAASAKPVVLTDAVESVKLTDDVKIDSQHGATDEKDFDYADLIDIDIDIDLDADEII